MGIYTLFPGGTGPDNTGTGNNSAALTYEVSTGTQTTNTPKATQLKLLFDAATDSHWMFSLIIPSTYVSGGTLRGKFKMASATSGNIIMKASQITVSDTAQDNASVFPAPASSGAVAVPGTAGAIAQFTITLPTTNFSPNRKCVIFIGRDADDAGDTATGNLELTNLNFEYV
jgi:hypothetical protein